MDLSPYGGPVNGAIEDHQVQEVDLATGKLVFFWDMLDHVNPADSELPASDASSSGGVWDAFHMNSIDEGPDGDLLISARNMWALYDISRKNGKIKVGHARRSGFETVIPTPSRGPYFQVRALDARGKVIGTSSVVGLGE